MRITVLAGGVGAARFLRGVLAAFPDADIAVIGNTADDIWLHGGTAIVAPTGEIVAKATTEEDEVIAYDCDMELGEYIRNTTFNFAKHRRPEHYKLIVERTGVVVEPSN